MRPISPPNGGETAEEQILDSWKEIASYLGRAVRTVQAWEKQEGLPVHRHQHRKAGTVYAYPSEIDAWRRGREDPVQPGLETSARTRAMLAAAAGLALAAGLGWVWINRPPGSVPLQSDPRPAGRTALLIAGFDNVTGEEILDGTLGAALERELAGQALLDLVSRERLKDSLQLTGRSLSTRIDADLAREIALKDGGIQAVVLGSVERVGPAYVLNLDLLDPVDGAVLARLTEEAPSQEEILPAVGRLSLHIRERLGELPAAGDESRFDLSTPSLRALQLYTRADRLFVEQNLGGTSREEAAEALLREAIVEDPSFAAAHTHLAWSVRRQWRESDEYLPHAVRAVELADGATIPERYFTRGSYSHMRSFSSGALSDVEAALAQYQALLELDPDHFWAIENSFHLLESLGRGQETLELSLRALSARPNDASAVSRVAESLVTVKGDLEEARAYVERAQKLRSELPIETTASDPFLAFFPVHESWVRGDVEKVVQRVDEIVESAGSLAAAESKSLAGEAVNYYLDLGMFQRATELQELYSVMPTRAWQFRIAWRRGQWDIVRELDLWRAERGLPDLLALVAADLASVGFTRDSQELLDKLPPDYDLDQGLVSSARGTVAFAQQRYEDAIPHLEVANRSLRYGRARMGYYQQSARTLSSAWEAVGQIETAIAVLEEASRQKSRVLHARSGWMETQLRLAEIHRATGSEELALAIEDELRRYCSFADPDFPVLVELERRGALRRRR